MGKIQWLKDYETGIDRIDFQHKNLVNILNDVISVPDLPPTQRKMVLEINLEALINYTAYHFESEEKFMREAHYPKYDAHVQEHEALKKTAVTFLERFKNGESDLELPITDFLRNWLINHIGRSDMDYVPYVIKFEKADGF
ncbi:MAG: bacteriohemerythrin [Pseudobdellovibrionaceae bacterium]